MVMMMVMVVVTTMNSNIMSTKSLYSSSVAWRIMQGGSANML